MGARKPADSTVAANRWMAALLAAGCNRYAELLVEQAETLAKNGTASGLEPQHLGAMAEPHVMDLESTQRLAEMFRQHAAELLAAHRPDHGG
jgi:hypothetical protein